MPLRPGPRTRGPVPAPGPAVSAWHAELAWLGPERGVAERVLIEVDGERITAVTEGADPPAGATRLAGVTIPGLANGHSHAFHRALRGRTHRGGGDFWTWRELMYQVAGVLDPDRYLELATATYAEMALAGITAVGEFHYLHHDPAGRPYADPNQMGEVLIEAAGRAGVRLTLIDTCYLRAGFDGQALAGAQVRFGDGDADALGRARRGPPRPARGPGGGRRPQRQGGRPGGHGHGGRLGRRPPRPPSSPPVRAAGREPGLHRRHRPYPGRPGSSAGVLGPRTTAVHATHLTGEDVALLGATRTTACFCPTTERDLADGIGPARSLADAGSPLCLGSDSHAVIDLFEEARAVELDERLATERRGHHRPADLLTAATEAGMTALGWDAGRLAPGRLADLVTVDLARSAWPAPAPPTPSTTWCSPPPPPTSPRSWSPAARSSPTATTCSSATFPPPSTARSPPSTYAVVTPHIF